MKHCNCIRQEGGALVRRMANCPAHGGGAPHAPWCPARGFTYEVGSGEPIPGCSCDDGDRNVLLASGAQERKAEVAEERTPCCHESCGCCRAWAAESRRRGWEQQPDPAALRAMAERWADPKAPEAIVRIPWDPSGRPIKVNAVLRKLADAMEEAARP